MTFVKVKATKRSLARRKPVYGVGINDADYMTCPDVNGKQSMCPIYRKWTNMLERCYDPKYLIRKQTYIGCSVCDEWLTFSNFSSWYEKHNIEGYHLDKDLKIKGNKIYSPDTCLFVSLAINNLFTDRAALRGLYKIGVNKDNRGGRYQANIMIDGKKAYLGSFRTENEAHTEYIKAKNKEINRKMIQHPELAIYLKQHIKEELS